MSNVEKKRLSQRIIVFLFMLGSLAFLLGKPTQVRAGMNCNECYSIYSDCLASCDNWPNGPDSYCSGAPSVYDQQSCYAYASQFYQHCTATCNDDCNPALDPCCCPAWGPCPPLGCS